MNARERTGVGAEWRTGTAYLVKFWTAMSCKKLFSYMIGFPAVTLVHTNKWIK